MQRPQSFFCSLSYVLVFSEMLFGGSFSHDGGDTGAPSTSSELQMQSKLSDQSERRADGETREDKGG